VFISAQPHPEASFPEEVLRRPFGVANVLRDVNQRAALDEWHADAQDQAASYAEPVVA
jgi:hypothetical protein